MRPSRHLSYRALIKKRQRNNSHPWTISHWKLIFPEMLTESEWAARLTDQPT